MTQPNILCVSVDSLRADYTSLDGQDTHDTTPFLASLASDSAVYCGAITPSTWTLPVHASVFTGLFPPEHGLTTGEEILGDHPTFAELLSENGYSTRAFYRNSWLDTGEILRGFKTNPRNEPSDDESTSSVKCRISEFIEGISPRLETLTKRAYHAGEQYLEWQRPLVNGRKEMPEGGQTVCEALERMDQIEEPFCWFVHLNDAHWLYNPPSPYHRVFPSRNDIELAYNYGFWQDKVYGSRTNRLKTTVGDIRPPEKEVETFKDLYRGGVRYCDHLIETLVGGLKEAGRWEDTVLIVFGDHGDGFGEDGVFGHHFTVHDSVIRVPLLVRDPTGRIEADTVSTPASLVDIYPTILGLAEVSGPSTNGVDLAEDVRDYAYTYYDLSEYEYYTEAHRRGVEQDRLPPAKQFVIWGSENMKGISYPDESTFIEIGEGTEPLRKRLEEHTKALNPIDTQQGGISDEVADRLKDMGYLRE